MLLVRHAPPSLRSAEECLELQVPIDCGNGRWNCGVSLARLLWDVPVPALTSLLASMLLERRIILVSSQRDTVTAAVQAASALLYPFKCVWRLGLGGRGAPAACCELHPRRSALP